MFRILPVELIEQIFLYLSIRDILSVFSAFNQPYNVLSDYFWKSVCVEEDFLRAYTTQEWYKCFQCGVNKRLEYYTKVNDIPPEELTHVYLNSLITRDTKVSVNTYNIYFINDDNTFQLIQKMTGDSIQFKEEFIVTQEDCLVVIYKYNYTSRLYESCKSLPELINNIFGITSKYCAAYDTKKICFNLYSFSNECKQTFLPPDVKFLIHKILYRDNIVISTLSSTGGYKIKLYDIDTDTWTLDLVCFSSTGITNDPNIWVSSNFIGCCDVSYRLRGIYFGTFKVWDNKGKMLFHTDIEPSTKHYLRCFFKEKHVLLTTSDNTVNVFNNTGENVSRFHVSTSFLDIKLSTGYLLFVLLEEKDSVEIYDWRVSFHLYSIKLYNYCSKALSSDFLYCPVNCEGDGFEVIRFF